MGDFKMLIPFLMDPRSYIYEYKLSYAARPVITDITASDITATGYTIEESFLHLVCITYGIPTPAVTWIKDGVLLDNQVNVIIHPGESGRHALTIILATADLYGSYTCSASNLAAVVNSTKVIEIVVPVTSVKPEYSQFSGRLVYQNITLIQYCFHYTSIIS